MVIVPKKLLIIYPAAYNYWSSNSLNRFLSRLRSEHKERITSSSISLRKHRSIGILYHLQSPPHTTNATISKSRVKKEKEKISTFLSYLVIFGFVPNKNVSSFRSFDQLNSVLTYFKLIVQLPLNLSNYKFYVI